MNSLFVVVVCFGVFFMAIRLRAGYNLFQAGKLEL